MGKRKEEARQHERALKKAAEEAEIKAKNEATKATKKQGDVVVELNPDGTVKRKIIV